MAVVINEFEVLREAEPAARGEAAAQPGEGRPVEQPDPLKLQEVLRRLEQQALRVWAH